VGLNDQIDGVFAYKIKKDFEEFRKPDKYTKVYISSHRNTSQ